ncbi:MAG: hypothetical protein M1837_004410 [Sclerophora amabilis]|nr:MAG: hypothetical protein M1837_004410 [Sclerophora amabilis]
MVFQTSVPLQTISSVTGELWPSMSNLASLPWKTLMLHPSLHSRNAAQPKVSETGESQARAKLPSSKSNPDPELPDCLRSTPMTSLHPNFSATWSGNRTGLQHPLTSSKSTFLALYKTILTKDIVPRNAFDTVSSFTGKVPSAPPSSRQLSTMSSLRLQRVRSTFGLPPLNNFPKRTLFGGNSSRNLLAHMEQTANNNPQSASAQNAFYQALLRADMAYIVAERHQTGKYATNPACDAAYTRALERIGQIQHGQAIPNNGIPQGQNQALSSEQYQSIGQAVAAQSRGANIAMARGKTGPQGTGAKESPLYVVVEETIGGTIFKWAKFLFYFGLVTYLSLVVLTILIETTGILKKVSGTQNNEAQPQQQKVRFSDVHGCDEAKEELQELVEFLKNPDKFSTLGGKLPKGVLLIGPPGTGKTLLARAVAGEAGVPFFFMSGSEFDEIYVGVGAKRVRELFSAARAKAPAIVFIDELDAIGGKRNDRDAAYVKQTLNQLLTDLDGFSQSSGVIFLAATNFPQSLDKALTRPGRFDRNVVVPLPDVRGRVDILKYHMKNVQVSPDVDVSVIARGTPGFSGAELENVVNQAAVHASRQKLHKVGMLSFEWAKDKIMMGAERRSAVIQQKDKVLTAYHEGGHALVALFTDGADPLYKATIMPRGQALGITYQLPEIDKVSMMKKEYLARIDVCMGGKVAEELVYGSDAVTSGVYSDLQQATKVAYAMVTQMGMSEELGNVDFGTDYARLSSETKQRIESEVKTIIEAGRERATKLLTTRRKELDLLAKALVEYETLSKDEIEKVVKGEKLPNKLSSIPNVPLKLPESLLPAGIGGGDATSGGPGVDATSSGSGSGPGPNDDGGAKL